MDEVCPEIGFRGGTVIKHCFRCCRRGLALLWKTNDSHLVGGYILFKEILWNLNKTNDQQFSVSKGEELLLASFSTVPLIQKLTKRGR